MSIPQELEKEKGKVGCLLRERNLSSHNIFVTKYKFSFPACSPGSKCFYACCHHLCCVWVMSIFSWLHACLLSYPRMGSA